MVIKWSDFAKDNLKYFIETSKLTHPLVYAESLVRNLFLLTDNPRAGKLLFTINDLEVRQLIYKKHRIIYRINNDTIDVGAVIHTSQNLEISIRFAKRFFQ